MDNIFSASASFPRLLYRLPELLTVLIQSVDVWSTYIFHSLQGPLMHLLFFGQLALITVEKAQVTDCVERRCMVCTKGFLISLQSPLMHLLCLSQLPLIVVETAQVVDCIERGYTGI
jgi:hypothetical protein